MPQYDHDQPDPHRGWLLQAPIPWQPASSLHHLTRLVRREALVHECGLLHST
ncbi:DUF6525 family protein [Borborobacter arsenicus]|uniref:DUF6525 family protein n=1 Tax=Borborobacter arsenicus TaxID=1851146 RepID=UPI003CCAB23E